MNGGQWMVIMIVAIVMVASIVRSKYGYSRHRRSDRPLQAEDNAENQRLRDEIQQLKERMKVLERITVEKENSLAKEIESLRDR